MKGGNERGSHILAITFLKQWRAFSYNHTEDDIQGTVTCSVPPLLWDYCEDWSHEQRYSWVYRHKGDTHFLKNIFNTEFQLEMHYITIVLLNEIYVCNGWLYTPNTPNAVNKGLELETNVFL